MSVTPTQSQTKNPTPTAALDHRFTDTLIARGTPDPRFIPKSVPVQPVQDLPQILKNIPNIEKLWPVIQKIPGGTKWLLDLAKAFAIKQLTGNAVKYIMKGEFYLNIDM